MAAKKNSYGFDRIINIILAIIPITNIIFGVINRAKKANWLGVILNIVLCFIFYWVDLITVILDDEIKLLAD